MNSEKDLLGTRTANYRQNFLNLCQAVLVAALVLLLAITDIRVWNGDKSERRGQAAGAGLRCYHWPL